MLPHTSFPLKQWGITFKLNRNNKNPLFSPRTETDFRARWPGATCNEFPYDPGLSVFVLRLEDGALVAVCGNDVDIWEKGMALLEKGRARRPRPPHLPGTAQHSMLAK
jgi:hypothetical protein